MPDYVTSSSPQLYRPVSEPGTLSYSDVIRDAQLAPQGTKTLAQIWAEINQAANAQVTPSAPVTEEQILGPQPGMADLIKSLGLDRDWNAEAERILAEKGMVKPEKPAAFKPGIGAILAAAGPALGALFGGAPAMAAPGAAAALGGYRAGWEETEKKYEGDLKDYVEASANLADRMQTRATQQASMLLPYFATTAAERANARISVQQLNVALKNMDNDSRRVALEGFRLSFEREAQLEDRQYRRNLLVLDALKAVDARTADQMRIQLERDRLAQDKENEAQRLAIARGELSVSWYNAKTSRYAATQRAASAQGKMDQLLEAVAIDKLARGDVGGFLEIATGGKVRPGDVSEADRLVLMQYMSVATKDPKKVGLSREQIDVLRQKANVVFGKLGMPEFPIPEPSKGWDWKGFFKNLLGG